MIAAAMGWIGTLGTMGAYVMLTRGRWQSASLRYSTFNAIGGLLCATASAAYAAWPSVASNLVWSGIAVHSAVLALRHRRTRRIDGVQQMGLSRPLAALTRVASARSGLVATMGHPR
jgi:hypothetical protein